VPQSRVVDRHNRPERLAYLVRVLTGTIDHSLPLDDRQASRSREASETNANENISTGSFIAFAVFFPNLNRHNERMHTTAAFTLTCLLNFPLIVTGDAAFVSSTSIRRIPKVSKAGGLNHRDHGAFVNIGMVDGQLDGVENSKNFIRERPGRDFGPLGHDYLPAVDAGPISPLVLGKLTEEQIHYLIARRLQCKKSRNYSEADQILSGLVAAGVYLQDKRKEWRADGQMSFGRKKISYVRRGGQGQLSEDDVATVASMVESRAQAKRKEDFYLSDQLGDALKAKYGVKVNDKRREWSINTINNSVVDHNNADVYVPSPIAPKDDPTHLMMEESKVFIQERLMDREAARKSKNYAMADMIRDELKDNYSVVIDDRTKEWKVVTSEEDSFATEAQASQRSAFVREKESSLEEDFGILFGDSPVEEDEEGEPDSSTTTIASVDDESVLAPKQEDALDESSHLSTLTVVVLKEKLRKAGLPVSGKNKAELIGRLMNQSSS
jgi:hypothetical protein